MRPKSASVKATPGLVQPHLVNASAPSRHGNSNVSQKNSLQSAPLLSVAHSLHAPLVQQYRPQLAQQYQRNRAPNFSQKLQQREIVPNNQPAYMYQNQATLPENLKQPVPKKNKSSVRLLNFSSTKKMKTYSQNWNYIRRRRCLSASPWFIRAKRLWVESKPLLFENSSWCYCSLVCRLSLNIVHIESQLPLD